MANFMGPMAPPQAAPNAPPQLDIRTNPSQRAQFKEFMQGMNRPVMPPTTAPIAPMLPAPMSSPMDQIDIFAPVPMANGGVADPFAIEGKIGQSVGPKMVGGTTNVIDASGNDPRPTDEEVGVLAKRLQLGQDLYDINQSYNDPGRPMFGMADLFAPGGALSFAAPSFSPSSAPNMMQNAMQGILSATQMDGPMGSTIGIRPVARDGNLGIMANFSMPFEDGGPVRMRRGGSTFRTGSDGRTVISSDNIVRDDGMTDRERAAFSGVPSGVSGDDPYDEFSGGGDSDDGQSTAEIIAQMDADSENFDPGPGSVLTGNLVSDPAPAANIGPSGQIFAPTTPITEESGQRAIDAVMSIPGMASVDPIAAPTMDVIDPMTDLLAGEPGTSGAGDDSLSAALNRLYSTPITNMRGGAKRSAAEDLLIRTGRADMPTDSGGGFPSLAKLAVDVFTGIGKGKAGDIADNIEMGRPAVIDAQTGQITGYVGDGFIKGTKTYTGRAGYDPFGEGATFDPSRNAYVVNRQQPNQSDDDERASGQTPATPPPATDPADTTPPPLMITPPTTGLPPSMPDPTDVLVPSTRRDVSVTVPSILPTEGLAPTVLPQSFLDLLASFNRPAPRAMQDGGAVLDKAADDFLEALRVA